VRLFAMVSSCRPGGASTTTMFSPRRSILIGKRGRFSGFHPHALRNAAIDRHVEINLSAIRIIHPHDQVRRLADDAEAWRLDQFDPAVAPVGVAHDQAVDRTDHAFRIRFARNIMQLAIGNQNGARDPVTWHIRHQAFQCAVKMRAIVIRVAFQNADFKARVFGKFRLHLVIGLAGGGCPVADIHTFGTVQHHGCHGGQGLAFFMHQARIGKRCCEQRQAQSAGQPGAAAQENIGQPCQHSDAAIRPRALASLERDRTRCGQLRSLRHPIRQELRLVIIPVVARWTRTWAETVATAIAFAQTFQQGRQVNLIVLVAAGQNIHDEIDAKAPGHFTLVSPPSTE
jgi:hypothetical protein